ncbi:MAG: MOSC domain-containing protein [Gemmatimonadaceae bacterium]
MQRRKWIVDDILTGMTLRAVGRISSVLRYPVKSMALESVDSIEVDWNGLTGDRRWGFVRESLVRSGFPWLTIRERPDMWTYQPFFVEPDRPELSVTMVRTPTGEELDIVDRQLAAELGEGVRVIKQTRGIFDTMPLSLISTRTVDAIAHLSGAAIDARRFRPNFLVEAVDDLDFVEDNWVGATLKIGSMMMRVDKRDKRCVVVNVDPDTTERDPSILRVIAQKRQACLGVYGTTVEPGRVSVGDSVSIAT